MVTISLLLVSLTSSSPQKDTVNWINDFRDFRNAVYQNDKIKVKQFIDLPIMNEGNEIWYLVPEGNKGSSKIVSKKISPFTEKDFDTYFHKLFPKRFITTILKIKSADLFKNGTSETINFEEGNTTYRMMATYDKAEKKLQLNLFSNTVIKDKEGEIEDGGESSVIYQFDILKNGHLKFIQVRLAG